MTYFTPRSTQSRARRAALLGLAALAATGTAWADPAADLPLLPRVVVEGRAQLLAACPGAEAQIQNSLEGSVWRRQVAAVMPVRFTLQGSRITDVQVGNGPQVYAVRLRQVLGALQCSGPQQSTQVHEFSVNLRTS